MFSQQQYPAPSLGALGFFGGPLVDGGGYVWIPGRGPVPIGPWRPDFGYGAFLPQMQPQMAQMAQMAQGYVGPMAMSYASFGATLDALPAELATVRRYVMNALADEKARKLIETKNGQLELIKQALDDADVRTAIRTIAARHFGLDALAGGGDARARGALHEAPTLQRRALQEWIEIGVGVLVIGGLIAAFFI